MRKKQTIEEAAKAAMTPQNEINCSGYVRTVALDLGEYMPPTDANEMEKYLAGNIPGSSLATTIRWPAGLQRKEIW